MTEPALDEADMLLVATVDTAIEVGTGRTFTTPSGAEVRVAALEETWVRLEVMRAGVAVETLSLPRDIRRIARMAARVRAEIES